ncbi:MAG: DNA polymerase III subunit delta [Cytophagales bacterium]
MIEPIELFKQIEEGKLAPVYFLFGEEPFFIDEASVLFEEKVLKPHEKDFNMTVCYGKETSLADILNHAKRFPMMSDKQLVIVKEAQENPDFEKDPNKTPFLKHFDNYLQNPLPSTVLVLCYKDKFDQRKSLWKTISKHAVVVESKKIYDKDLEGFVKQTAQRKKIAIAEDAVKILAENVGNNLSRIGNELDKVSINIKPNEKLTAELIEKFVGISREYNPFEYQKALGIRDTLKSYKIARYLGQHPKEYPLVMIVKGVFDFYAGVLLCHSLKLNSVKTIQDTLRKNFYQANDLYTASKNYPTYKLFEVIDAISQADLKSKGIGADQMSETDILMELTHKILR